MVFVCTNERDASDPRGDCKTRGGEALLERLKTLVADHKLKGKVRVTKSGCLDYCAKGCTLAVYSENPAHRETWYTHVQASDADALSESHILGDQPLLRLVEPTK